MFSFVENKGSGHVSGLIADINLHGDELHGNIEAYFIDGNGGILIHFSGNTVQEAFIQPVTGLWSPAVGFCVLIA